MDSMSQKSLFLLIFLGLSFAVLADDESVAGGDTLIANVRSKRSFLDTVAIQSPAMAAGIVSQTDTEALPALIANLHPRSILSVTKRLNTTERMRVLSSLNSTQIMDLTQRMTADQRGQLLGYLPADGVVSLAGVLSQDQLGTLLTSLPVESIVNLTQALNQMQNFEIISMLSPEGILGLLHLLNDSQAMGVLGRLPVDGILNITKILSSDQLGELIGSLPPSGVLQLVLSFPRDAVPELVSKLPDPAIETLTMSFSRDQLSQLLTALTPEAVLHIIGALNSSEVSQLMIRLPSESILNLTRVLPKENMVQLLESASPQALQNVTNSLDPSQLLTLLQTLTPEEIGLILKSLTPEDLGRIMNELPPTVVAGLVTSLPPADLISTINKLQPDVVSNITAMLSPDQLSHLLLSLTPLDLLQLVAKLPPDVPGQLLMSVPTQTLLNLTKSLPPGFAGPLFNLIQPEDIANLMKNISISDIVELLPVLPPSVVADVIPFLDLAMTEQILKQVSPDVITNLLPSLPQNVTVSLMGSLSNDTVVTITNKLSPDQLIIVLSSLPQEVVNDLLTKLPVETVLGLLGKATSAQLSELLRLIPKSYVSSLITSLPPDVVVNLTLTLPPENLALILLSINSTDVAKLLSVVPQNIVVGLVIKVPPQFLPNLTSVLPTEKVIEILMLLNSTTMSNLLSTFPKQDLASLITKLQQQPAAFVNLTMSLPQEALVTILTSLPESQVSSLVQSFPGDAINSLITKLPVELVLNLTRVLPGSFITNLPVGTLLNVLLKIPGEQLVQLINEIFPKGPLSILALVPQDLLTEIMKSITPDQIKMLLQIFPPEQLKSMISGLLPDLMQMFSQGGATDLAEIIGPAMQSILNIPISSLLDILGPLIPELPRMLARSVGELGTAMLTQDTDQQLQQCVMDIQLYLMTLANGTDWAVSMFDATGKPSRGLLKGNTHMHGNYDQCLDVSHILHEANNTKRELKGRYCGSEFQLPPGVLPPVPGEGILPDVKVELYLCLPNSCTGHGLSQLMSAVNLPLNISIPRISCQEDPSFSDDNGAIAATCVLCLLGCLIFVSTTLDVVRRRKKSAEEDFSLDQPKPETNGGFEIQGKDAEEITVDVGPYEKQTSFITRNGGATSAPVDYMPKEDDDDDDENETDNVSGTTRALLAFSLPINTERILGINDVTDSITCLHGIRVLSICWVIVGHSFFFMATYFENALGAAEALETVLGQVVIHSTLAIDAFFVISGCLASFTFLRQAASEGGVKVKNLLIYYIHRYIRLTPAYAIAIMAFVCLIPYMSDGPNWTRESTSYFRSCKKYWWTNILYVNNFYKSLDDQCVPWGWYLSTDLQFHWIVAPLILVPYAMGWVICTSLLIGWLVILQIVLTVYFQSEVDGDYLRNRDEFWWKIFEKPYTRIAPFVLGLGLGYMLTRLKGHFKVSKTGLVVGWFLAIGACFAAVLVKYDENHVMLEDSFHWSQAARSAHEALYRPIFSFALCWIILFCATGNGGFINSILSWKVFIPFSHLAFCMYLLHPAVILADMWQARVPVYFTVSYVLQRASGYIMLSAIFAYFLSVTVETPIVALAKILFKRRKRNSAELTSAL